MLQLRARVDLGAMAMKGYSAFPKAPALLTERVYMFVGMSMCIYVYLYSYMYLYVYMNVFTNPPRSFLCGV